MKKKRMNIIAIVIVIATLAMASFLPFASHFSLAEYSPQVWSFDGTNLFSNIGGAVGIGDNSPDTGTSTLKLDVEGPVGATEYCDENGNNCTAAAALGSDASNIHDADNNTVVHTETNANEDIIRFSTGGTEYFTMDGPRIGIFNAGGSVFVGENAGAADDLSGNQNTFIGHQSGEVNTLWRNTAIGYQSLNANVTGAANTALGNQALYQNIRDANTAIGNYALYSSLTGSDNTAVGDTVLYSLTTGQSNTALGRSAFFSDQTGSLNVAIGRSAGSGAAGSSKDRNTIVGANAGFLMDTGADNNILLGYDAGSNITTGANNIIIGYDIDAPNVIGSNQMSIGNLIYGTGVDGTGATISSGAIGIGDNSPDTGTSTLKLDVEGPVGATEYCDEDGNNCVSAGTAGGGTILHSTEQTLISRHGGSDDTGGYTGTGLGNNFLGYRSGHSNTSGWGNNFFGEEAGFSNTDGESNNFLGYYAGYSNTSGLYNNFFGESAGQSNTLGQKNNFIGYYAGVNNTIGEDNNFFGDGAGRNNISGNGNNYIGKTAGRNNASGSENIALGTNAAFGTFGESANYTVALGYRAGQSVSSAVVGESVGNIFVGMQAGDNITTGSRNITLGYDIDGVFATGDDQLNIGNMIYGTGIDGTGSTISSGAIGIGDNSPDTGTSTLKLDVEGPVGATEYCDENGNNCTAAGSLGGFTGTTGSVPFAGAAGSLTEDNANLFWDDTNDRLGVGTNTPAFLFDVNDAVKVNSSGQIGLIDGDPGGDTLYISKLNLRHDTDETDFNNAVSNFYYGGTERWLSTVNAGTLPTTGINLYYTGSFRTPWITGAHDYAGITGDESETVYGGTGTVNNLKAYFGFARLSGTGTANYVTGVQGKAQFDGGATIGRATGVIGDISSWGAVSTIADAAGLRGVIQGNANITDAYGLRLDNWSATGLVTNSYGIYMDSSIDVGTTSYALYSSSNSDSYLAGDLGIGTNTPITNLDINGGVAYAIQTVVANYVATTSDHMILCDATAGAVQVTLPDATTVNGLEMTVKKTDAVGANACTLVDAVGANIDGLVAQPIAVQYNSITVMSDGTQWWIK